MIKLLKKLYKSNLITPIGFYHLVLSVLYSKINLMALLCFSSKLYSQKLAVKDENEELTFKELYNRSKRLALVLQEDYKVGANNKIAILCRNHISLIKSIFSISQLGADIYLINTEIKNEQFNLFIQFQNFDLIIFDYEFSNLIVQSSFSKKSILSYHKSLPSIDSLSKKEINNLNKLKRCGYGKIIIETGGTTGKSKSVKNNPGSFVYIKPFFSLLTKVNLDEYSKVYIATPIFHSYGIATMIMTILLGKESYLLERFNFQKAINIINLYKIELVALVPVMLHRIINNHNEGLNSLRCIISGGDFLNPILIKEIFLKYNIKLFNLYGTSEAGLSMIATPEDLKYSFDTIGKKINGIKIKILDSQDRELNNYSIGRICVKRGWSVRKKSQTWIETGDLGYKDKFNYYFLNGRIDEMIVSGGENIYPSDLENILMAHSNVKEVAVIGIKDEEFGQRLKAFIIPFDAININEEQILSWLSTRAKRAQMPKFIEFVSSIPYTSIGKLDKKALS